MPSQALDGSGFKREHADFLDSKETPAEVQVALPSGLFLDDFLIPDGMGALEKISYDVPIKEPVVLEVPFSYLFFDPTPNGPISYPQPRQLVYSNFIPAHSKYVRYFINGPLSEYFSEEQYEHADNGGNYIQNKYSKASYFPHTSFFSTPYASFGLNYKPHSKKTLDTKSVTQNLQKIFSKPEPDLEFAVSTTNLSLDFYKHGSYLGRATTILQISGPNPISAPTLGTLETALILPRHIPQGSFVYNPTFNIRNSDLREAKEEINPNPHIYSPPKQDFKIFEPKTAPNSYVEVYPQKIIPAKEIQLAKEPFTLEDNVRLVQVSQGGQRRETYVGVISRLYGNSFPNKHRATKPTEQKYPRLELKVMDIIRNGQNQESTGVHYIQERTPRKYKPDGGEHTKQTEPNPYPLVQKLKQINYVQIYRRNYDTSQYWINTPSSNFWKSSSFYKGPIQLLEERVDQERTLEEKPDYKSAKKYPKKSYKSPKKGKNDSEKETVESNDKNNINAANAENGKEKPEDYQASNEKDANEKIDDKKPSYAAAAGMIAGAGLLAVAGGALSLIRRKKRKYEHLSESNNYQAKVIPIPAIVPTIDSVVQETQAQNKFNPLFRSNMSSLVAEMKTRLGYGKIGIYIEDNETKESYGLEEDTLMPTPSLNKVAITFAAAYLAQRGLLDITGKIPLDQRWVHDRETQHNPKFLQPKAEFEYSEMRKATNRESSNTHATNLLRFIGKGDIELGMRMVNEVMEEVGIYEIKMKAPYQRGERYDENVGTAKSIAKLMRTVKSGQYLNEQNTREIMEDLEATRTKDLKEQITEGFRDLFPKSDIGIKQTLWERGMGYTFYIGNKYTGTVIFDGPGDVLYRDMSILNDQKKQESRKPTTIFEESRRYITKINQLLSQELNPKKPLLQTTKAA